MYWGLHWVRRLWCRWKGCLPITTHSYLATQQDFTTPRGDFIPRGTLVRVNHGTHCKRCKEPM